MTLIGASYQKAITSQAVSAISTVDDLVQWKTKMDAKSFDIAEDIIRGIQGRIATCEGDIGFYFSTEN